MNALDVVTGAIMLIICAGGILMAADMWRCRHNPIDPDADPYGDEILP